MATPRSMDPSLESMDWGEEVMGGGGGGDVP